MRRTATSYICPLGVYEGNHMTRGRARAIVRALSKVPGAFCNKWETIVGKRYCFRIGPALIIVHVSHARTDKKNNSSGAGMCMYGGYRGEGYGPRGGTKEQEGYD